MEGAADSAAPSVCTTSEKHPAESTLPKVRQRAELDREQSPDLVRVTDQVVVQSGNPRRAGYAPQPEQRHSLHVGAQTDKLGDAGLDRGHHEPLRRDLTRWLAKARVAGLDEESIEALFMSTFRTVSQEIA